MPEQPVRDELDQGFDSSRGWESMYATLLRVKAGERIESGMDSPMIPLVIAGFVESVEVTKPCRTCGKPQFDYRYTKITGAGRIFMAAAAQAMRPNPSKSNPKGDHPCPAM